MVWRAYLGLTMQGALGPELDLAKDGGTVAHTLNDHDEVELTVSRASLDGVPREWWSVRAGCLVVTYTDAGGVERIISATPISEPPTENRKAGTVTLKGRGVTWLLEDRVLLRYDPTDDSHDPRKTQLQWRDRTFAAIIGGIVKYAVETKRQGYLPIARPDSTVAGGHTRTYEGFNLGNNGAWKRIKEITEVIGGPDVMFRPEWTDSNHTHFRWRVIVGSDEQQVLPQDREIRWDATAPGTDVAAIDVVSSAENLAHRVFATGAGEGAKIALAWSEMKTLPEYMPVVEKVIAVSDEEADDGSGETIEVTSALLKAKASGALASNNIDQVNVHVRADPDQMPIGTWWCGEAATVKTAAWLMVPDGEYLLRIIATQYQIGSDIVEVRCQEEELGDDYVW